MTKKRLIMAGLMIVWSGVAIAGLRFSFPVSVELEADGSGAAQGNMATARYSDNDIDQIGCGVRVFSDPDFGEFKWGFCQARDAEGDGAFCFTESEALIDAMETISDQSFITFRFNASQTCTYIGFSSQSQYLITTPQDANKPY